MASGCLGQQGADRLVDETAHARLSQKRGQTPFSYGIPHGNGMNDHTAHEKRRDEHEERGGG
jgi:hypothetical protein